MSKHLALLVLLAVGLRGFAAAPPAVRRDLFGDPLPPGAIARLGSMRLRHLTELHGLAVSPDGSRIATQGETIRLWDRASGRLLREHRVEGAQGTLIGAMSFTPDGKKLFSAPYLLPPFAQMRTYDLATGKEEKFWAKPSDHCFAEKVAFSRDGAWMAILWSGFDEEARRVQHLRLFDLVKKKEHPLVLEEGHWVVALGFSHDNRRLLIAGWGELQFWGVECRKKVSQISIPLHGSYAHRPTLAVSPDGRTVAVQQDSKSIVIVRRGAKSPAAIVCGSRVHYSAFQFSADGKELFVVQDEGGIIAVDPATGRRSRIVLPARDCPSGKGCFSGDGRWLVFYANAAMEVVSTRTGKRQHSFDDHRDYEGIDAVASPDGRKVATRSSGEVRIWDLRSGKVLSRIRGRDFIAGLRWSQDGRHVVVASGNELVWWDADMGKRARAERLLDGGIFHAALLSGGKRACCTFSTDKHPWHLAILDLTRRGKPIYCAAADHEGVSPQVSADGRRALTLTDSEDGTVLRVLDPGSYKTLWQRTLGPLCHDPGPTIQAVFSPDGSRVVVLTEEAISIHETASGRKVGLLPGVPSPGLASVLGLSPDGRTLLLKQTLGFRDAVFDDWQKKTKDRVSLVEVATGQVRHELPVLPRVSGGHITRDGRHLITASQDGTALVWEVNALAAPSSLVTAWADLASADARKGFAAVCSLAASPQRAVEMLRDRLMPARIDAREVRRWIADLGSDALQRRIDAETRLAQMGSEDVLLQALEQTKELEAHLRLHRLLAGLRANGRQSRSLEVLERIGSPEAVRLLERLAAGHSDSPLAREARETLRRLERR
jgi:WD40 repeat protein